MAARVCDLCGKTFPTKSNKKRFCSRGCAHIASELKQMENEQLCWRCKKACGGCSWSAEFIPIEGWEAEPTIIKDTCGDIQSFRIKVCPEFTQIYKI